MTRADLDPIVAQLQSACEAVDAVIAQASDPELLLLLHAHTEAAITRLIRLSSNALSTKDALVDAVMEQKVA